VLRAARQTRQHLPAHAPRRPLASRRVIVLIGAPVAAALIVIAVVFGLASSNANQQLDQAEQRSQAVAAVLTARDARMMTGQVAGGGSATVVMSHRMGELVFTAAGLPPLPAASGYELWLTGSDGVRAAGMLRPGSYGMAGPVIASGIGQGDHLMLSVEPAGGTRHPTTPIMLDIPL
jgi:anti-sigma-K factor RskA